MLETVISSAKCPLRILAKTHDFRTCESLANPCESPFAKACESLRKLAKPWIAKACEGLRNTAKPYLRICAKACESLRNHTCESLRNLSIIAKAYLRKLAKIHAFRTCESLRKHDLRNLAKGEFIAPPSPPWLRPARSTRSISVVILNVFRLFVIMIPKPIVSVVFLSFVCPKSFLIKVCQPTCEQCEEIQLHICFKSIRSCVIYLT